MSIEVLDVGERSLSELADIIEDEHRACTQALNTALMHAIKAGEALDQAHQIVPRGDWMAWVENLEISRTTCNLYVRLYVYRDRLHPGMGIREARHHLAGLPQTYPYGGNPGASELALQQAAELVTEHGFTLREAALDVGVSQTTVWRFLNPEKAREIERRKAARETERARLRKTVDRDQAIKRAVRKAGAAMTEMYAMAERMQDVLAQAQRETEDQDAKRALSEAGVHYRKMRDDIVRALGVA